MNTLSSIVRITPHDNVGIVSNPIGLDKGTIVLESVTLKQSIPMGHKVALMDVTLGGAVIRYGQIIGYANKGILKGDWINETSISLPSPPKLDEIEYIKPNAPEPEALSGYTFLGYKNSDHEKGNALV